MTEITRETLELAALAIGEVVECTEAEFHGCEDTSTVYPGVMLRGVQTAWCPHTYIGDAARLAVKLHLMTDADAVNCMATDAVETIRVRHDGTQPAKERAYCEAVTLCAAGIGRRMKGAHIDAQAAEIERLRDELALCCQLKREYQEQAK